METPLHTRWLIASSMMVVLVSLVGVVLIGGLSPSPAAPSPDSTVADVETSMYDARAGMCRVELVVDVAPGEWVGVHDGAAIGTDRTVRTPGVRSLVAVAPADATVVLYAVALEAGRAGQLRVFELDSDCGHD